ncbi:hypothetical protein [Sphingomonas sp. Leaf4]|uniref:hypothetical protein n=1 Tax=Sphingomonas sp. Leaf4 TaxID=2876553 RepID=UPI001E3267D3|nr:hypothetical protein [Sphingomonas sp. Leaf4]
MIAAVLTGLAVVGLPAVFFEVRRVWRDCQRQRRARADWAAGFARNWPDAYLGALPPEGPVWIGYDHGSESYAAPVDCAAGNADNVSTTDACCGGGDA